MKMIVTGCRGFVGSSVGLYAHERGHEVLGIANSSQAPLDWPARFAPADVSRTDLSDLIRDFNPDVVLHAAGSASVGASIQNPTADLQAALFTLSNMLESIRRSGRQPRVIFPSSAAVYGNPVSLPIGESFSSAPVSPYGFHKAACELLAKEYAQCFSMDVVICRLFSVYGPRQRRLLVWELFNQLAGAEPVAWLQGTGEESRDYLHIDDIADAFLQLGDLAKNPFKASQFQVFNLAAGVETSVSQLAHKVRDRVAPKKEVRTRGIHRPGDPLRWQADIAALAKCLPGWKPRSLDDGLDQCISQWKSLPKSGS